MNDKDAPDWDQIRAIWWQGLPTDRLNAVMRTVADDIATQVMLAREVGSASTELVAAAKRLQRAAEAFTEALYRSEEKP